MDTQQVEITGRSLLVSIFVSENIEVAEPVRDHGIDLIIHSNLSIRRFSAVPIQLKAAQKETFSVSKKYLKFPDLYMAYVWNVTEPQRASIYIMLHSVAVEIATRHGYTNSRSWSEKGGYSVNTRIPKALSTSLEPYKYTPGNLHKLISAL